MGSQRGIVMVYLIITWSLVVFLACCTEGNGAYGEKYFHVGCYKEDIGGRALPVLLANYSQSDQSNNDRVKNCANKVGLKGYKAFGVQNNGECWTGIDAIFVYAKYGNDSSCTNGVGGVKANDVYFLSFKVSHEGCFIEVLADMAMPILVANKIPNDPDPVQSCARTAWKKGFTKVFGLRNGDKCWSGNNAYVTYNKHGFATVACGSGGGLTIDVYRFDMSVPTTSVPQATVTQAVITPTTQGEIAPGYHPLGCYRQEEEFGFVSFVRLLGRVTKVINSTVEIQRCARAAGKSGYRKFGVKEFAECYGSNSDFIFQSLKQENDCKDGMGRKNSYFVYIFNRFMKTTSTPSAPRRTGTRQKVHDPKTHRTQAPPATLLNTTHAKSSSQKSTVLRRTTTLQPTTTYEVKTRPTFWKTTTLKTALQTASTFLRRTTTLWPTTSWEAKTRPTSWKTTTLKTASQTASTVLRRTATLRPTTSWEAKTRPTSWKTTTLKSASQTASTVLRRTTTLWPTTTWEVKPKTASWKTTTPKTISRESTAIRRNTTFWPSTPRAVKPTTTPRKKTIWKTTSRESTVIRKTTTLQPITPDHKENNGSNEIPHYRYIGCFKDDWARAMPEALELNWPKGSLASIKKCATISWSKGYQVFGVQYNGRECWSGVNARLTYTRYGNSTGCSNGIGGHWANDVYTFVSVKPNITSWPEPKNVKSGTLVTLFCNVSSSPLPPIITWYRGTNKIPTNIVTLSIVMDVYKQGYYWCNASNIPYGSARSQRLLLVVTDYFTSVIKLKAKENKAKENKAKKNKPKININDQPQDPCEQIVKYLSSKDKSREYKHAKNTLHRWEESNKLSTLDCVIYGKKKNQDEDLDDYYRSLVEILTEGAKRNKIEGLKIDWKSILVKDTGMCIKETTGKQNIQGFFTWQSTKIGDSVTVGCPLGPSGLSATRRCGGDFDTGAVWIDPSDDICSYKSKKTDAINNLSKKKVTLNNVKEVAKNFTKLFKSGSAKDMSEADADLAADMVDNILSVEDQLNETAHSVVEIIDTIMEMNASSLKANASSRIIKALDKIAEKIPLEKGTTSRVLNSTNLAIQANKVNFSTFKGLGFGISKNGDGGKSVVTSEEQSSLFVKIPMAAVENSNKSSPIRIGFIYFANHNLFSEEGEESGVERNTSDEVLSSSVFNTNTSKLSENVTLSFPRTERKDLQDSSCVYWEEGERRWSNEGCFPCNSDGDNEASVKCCCNHLTSFAVLFSPQNKPLAGQDEKHARILSIISYVGCGISLAGVLLTFLTYSLFRHLRKTNQQPILMSLCVAIAFLLIVFAVGVDRTSNQLGCQIAAALLHYFTLATILWMGVEAYNLYLQLVKVMAIYHRKFMLKASIFAWGVPALIVTATVVAAVIEYNANEDSDRVFYYGNDKVCILHNYTYRMVSWFVPILVTIVFNLVIFILVIYKLNCTGAMIPVDTKSNQKKRCWTAFAIMSLLGLTWLFGALAVSGAKLAFEYLFCIFNSLQGFFIFFFHCVRIKEVRNQWSFFVSGLGFSHKESETSHQRSRGFGESHHSSEAPYVKVKNWILRRDSNSDQPKRKITMSSVVDDKIVQGNVCDENKVDMELHEVRDPHENHALQDSDNSKTRDSSKE